MRHNKLRLFTIILLLIILSSGTSKSNIYSKDGDSSKGTPIDTCKYIFFLDGKRASAMSTLYKMNEGTVVYKSGFGNPKTAIFYYGEKARNGIMIFESVKNEDINNTDKK